MTTVIRTTQMKDCLERLLGMWDTKYGNPTVHVRRQSEMKEQIDAPAWVTFYPGANMRPKIFLKEDNLPPSTQPLVKWQAVKAFGFHEFGHIHLDPWFGERELIGTDMSAQNVLNDQAQESLLAEDYIGLGPLFTLLSEHYIDRPCCNAAWLWGRRSFLPKELIEAAVREWGHGKENLERVMQIIDEYTKHVEDWKVGATTTRQARTNTKPLLTEFGNMMDEWHHNPFPQDSYHGGEVNDSYDKKPKQMPKSKTEEMIKKLFGDDPDDDDEDADEGEGEDGSGTGMGQEGDGGKDSGDDSDGEGDVGENDDPGAGAGIGIGEDPDFKQPDRNELSDADDRLKKQKKPKSLQEQLKQALKDAREELRKESVEELSEMADAAERTHGKMEFLSAEELAQAGRLARLFRRVMTGEAPKWHRPRKRGRLDSNLAAHQRNAGKKELFRVFEEDKRGKVNIRACFLCDFSGSMCDVDRQVNSQVGIWLEAMGQIKAKAAAFWFSTYAGSLTVPRKMKPMKEAYGNTMIMKALDRARTYLRKGNEGTKLLVILTDGGIGDYACGGQSANLYSGRNLTNQTVAMLRKEGVHVVHVYMGTTDEAFSEGFRMNDVDDFVYMGGYGDVTNLGSTLVNWVGKHLVTVLRKVR